MLFSVCQHKLESPVCFRLSVCPPVWKRLFLNHVQVCSTFIYIFKINLAWCTNSGVCQLRRLSLCRWFASQQNKSTVARSHSADSEDNYVPMNPGSSILLNMERSNDSSQNLYIPMSPGPHHFDLMGPSSSTFPAHKGSINSQLHRRMSEIQPPPVNRNLKPDRKGKSCRLSPALRATIHQSQRGIGLCILTPLPKEAK